MKTFIAVNDKVIVKIVKIEEKSDGGIIIPDTVGQPQAYGSVISKGEKTSERIEPGMILVFHDKGGQVFLYNQQEYRVLANNEIYGIFHDDSVKEEVK